MKALATGDRPIVREWAMEMTMSSASVWGLGGRGATGTEVSMNEVGWTPNASISSGWKRFMLSRLTENFSNSVQRDLGDPKGIEWLCVFVCRRNELVNKLL